MTIQPVNQQIILIVPKLKDSTSGGIIIPASTQEKPHQGIVFKSDSPNFKPGDILLYRKYSGFNFVIEKTEYLVIEPGDVLVKLEETPEETSIRLEKEANHEKYNKEHPNTNAEASIIVPRKGDLV